jgi:hypothetical protein
MRSPLNDAAPTELIVAPALALPGKQRKNNETRKTNNSEGIDDCQYFDLKIELSRSSNTFLDHLNRTLLEF